MLIELKLCLGETTLQISSVKTACLMEYFDKKPDAALNNPLMPALLLANSPSAKHVK